MGVIVSLSEARVRRSDPADPAHAAPMHPALRWVAGDVYYLAHRRGADGVAACGTPGQLMLAPPGVPLCAACYPLAASGARRRSHCGGSE